MQEQNVGNAASAGAKYQECSKCRSKLWGMQQMQEQREVIKNKLDISIKVHKNCVRRGL
jgi:predicted nucleic-acid-binding Zn-ribbon protein